MLYVAAIVFPPLAILWCGKPFQAVFNAAMVAAGLAVFLPLVLLAMVHGLVVVGGHRADARVKRIVRGR